MFSRSSSQDVNTRAAAVALQAKAQAIRAQELALQAKEQLTPLAKSAQQSATQGLYQARTWAAPPAMRIAAPYGDWLLIYGAPTRLVS